jgi:hypothetical protein
LLAALDPPVQLDRILTEMDSSYQIEYSHSQNKHGFRIWIWDLSWVPPLSLLSSLRERERGKREILAEREQLTRARSGKKSGAILVKFRFRV